MQTEKITIHSMITITGRKIKYARIVKVQDSLIIESKCTTPSAQQKSTNSRNWFNVEPVGRNN